MWSHMLAKLHISKLGESAVQPISLPITCALTK
jgi:hypothetical protein